MSKAGGGDGGDDAAPTDAIVIDMGSAVTKVGFSGEDSPRTRFTTVVGHNTEKLEADLTGRVRATHVGGGGGGRGHGPPEVGDGEEKMFYAGDSVLARRETLIMSKPVQRTVVHDWDALEKLWDWCFAEELNVDPEAFPVLVMDSVLENKKARETMAKIMFEKFNVKSFYVATDAVLSLFSSGVTSGLVLESGDEVSRAVPVFEGFPLRHAATSTRLASRNVYAHFGRALQVSEGKE
jgi:actin